MSAIYESSLHQSTSIFSLHKYRNLANLPHFHDDYEIVFVENGNVKIAINGISFTINNGETAFIHSSEIHSIQSSPDSMVYVLKLSKQYVDNIMEGKSFSSPVLNNSHFTLNFINEIKQETSLMDKYSSLVVSNMLSNTLYRMMRSEQTQNNHCNIKNNNTNYISQISELMSNNYATITFKQAAKYMNFSEPYFSKLFKQLFGMTFTEYLNILRVGNAIKIMKGNDFSITNIATACGFDTIRNFNRTFKSLTGYSPSKLPKDYVFIYRIRSSIGIDPTLKCTEEIE